MARIKEITNGDDIIDSRDLTRWLSERESDRDCCIVTEETDPDVARWTAPDGTIFDDSWTEDDEADYQKLKAFCAECGGYAEDWHHGAGLIRDSYFETYAEQLAEDLGSIPKDAGWPATCIDWEKAAEELQQDYSAVEWDGVTYWVR